MCYVSGVTIIAPRTCSVADLILIQDPTDAEWLKKHDVANFAHVVEGGGGAAAAAAAVAASAGSSSAVNPSGGIIRLNDASRRVFDELQATEVARAGEKRAREEADAAAGVPPPDAAAHVTTLGVKTSGRFTASFTSTGVSLITRNEAAVLTPEDVAERRIAAVRALGKNAHVRLETTLGSVNLELACPLAPRTCENFIVLAKRGYYDGTPFHRSVRNFMVRRGLLMSRSTCSHV